MIKKFTLPNYTPKARQSVSKDPAEVDVRMQNRKVRALSQFRPASNRKQNLSMFEAADESQVQSPEESTPKNRVETNSSKEFGKVFGKKDPNGLSLPPIQSKKQPGRRYYMDNLLKALQVHSSSYLLRLYRDHFEEVVRGIQLFRHLKLEPQPKKITLPKNSAHSKTVILDLDETLIHCSQLLNHCTVRLPIPIENGMTVTAGVNIRPFCREFLKELSQFAEVIVFTASNSLYADTVINHLLQQDKWVSHRLYRQHCTLEKGLYIKDLRNLNRSLEDMVIVDNSSISYAVQPENGIPIIPFYDNNKDRELVTLLSYLRELLQQQDVRAMNRQHFRVDKFRENDVRGALLKEL